MIRTFLVDDHQLFRDGVRSLLSSATDIEVVGEASSGREAVALAADLEVDVILLDLSMHDRGGLDVAQELKERTGGYILVCTGFPEEHYAMRCLRGGADGYLTKTKAADELVQAIRKVASGRKFISMELAERVATSLSHHEDSQAPHERLSDREFQVLCRMGGGQSPSEIAEELCLSVKTISTYRSRILEKLGLENNAQLMRYAIEEGLVGTSR
jgi:DNA-binding NarL/FixJ family response regulator